MIMMNVILPLTMRNIQASYQMLFIVFYLLHMNIFLRQGPGPVKLAKGQPNPTRGQSRHCSMEIAAM